MLQEYNRILVVNSIILIAIALLFKYLFIPFLNVHMENPLWRNIVLISTATLLASPFLWAILNKKIIIKEAGRTVNSYFLNYSLTGISLHAIRLIFGIFLIDFFIDQIATTRYAIIIAVPVIAALLWFFSNKIQKIHQQIEQQFISNLNEREQLEYMQNKGTIELQQKNKQASMHFQEWNAYVTQLDAGDTIFFAGMSLYELKWKEKFGINIVYIRRGDRTIHLPNGKQRILPHDKMGILGTDEQISQLKLVFDQTHTIEEDQEDLDINDIQLIKVQIFETNPYCGKTIKKSSIRKDLRSHVAGIERDNDRILNPSSSATILVNDIIWLVGDVKKIKECLKNHPESFLEV